MHLLQRLGLVLIALITVVSAGWLGSSSAQEESFICNPQTTVPIVGTGPAGAGLLLRFGERVVGGGVASATGSYQLALAIGDERPGEYAVVVEVRSSREVLQRRTCVVPGDLPSAPVTPAGTRAPTVTARPGATAQPTVRASATPAANLTPLPTFSSDPTACAQEYPDFCIPPKPPDLDCTAIPAQDFTANEPDQHVFDQNNNGIGCEASDR